MLLDEAQGLFFWLLMKNRVNTRGVLRRRNMLLDDYTCEMCITTERGVIQLHVASLYCKHCKPNYCSTEKQNLGATIRYVSKINIFISGTTIFGVGKDDT
jgi:hypothetical protein